MLLDAEVFPLLAHEAVIAIKEAGERLGYRTYLVGGVVRDLIMKRPCTDVDIVCVGSGIELAQQAAEQIKPGKKVHVFKNFGTASFNHGEYNFEFVGARKESYRQDSRKPIVEEGSLEDDQNRRDFTINALAVSLNSEDFGQVIDPFGGLADIKRKRIKTPLEPGLTFSDDPLRMMRAVRFAAQLGFDIEADTFSAIAPMAERLAIVSIERVMVEFQKIVVAPKPSYGFKLLYHSGLLEKILPEMILLLGAANLEGKTHKDNFYHTLEVLDNVAEKTDDLWIRWSAILHDIAKPATKRFDPKIGWTFHGHEERGARMVPKIFARLKLPGDERMRRVQKLVRLHLRPIALVKDEVTDSAMRRLMVDAGEDLEALMLLVRADVTTKNANKAKRYLANFDVVEKKMVEVEAKDHLRNFQPVITGHHIMEAFGIGADARVGLIKTAVREEILDGTIPNTLEAALPRMHHYGILLGLSMVGEKK